MKKTILKQIIYIYVLMTLVLLTTVVSYTFQFIEGDWRIIIFNILRITIIAFIVTFIIFVSYTRKLVSPIKRLTKIATKVNVENMDIPIISTDENEVGELAHQFREMSLNLKQSFEEINLQKEELKAAEEYKRNLISNVSHELKTPLTTIKGFVETLMEDASLEQYHYLGIVHRNTERLISIINDLLNLSKLEQATELIKQEINMKSFINKIERIFIEEWRKHHIGFTFETDCENITFYADEFMLEQVFINLLDNAIKYAGKGLIKISARKQDDKLIIIVSDEGIGIPRKHLRRIFERFYVVDKSRSKRIGGTGLGLSIVKHIIILHGGEITVESEEYKGTSFIITLPIS